MERVIRIGSRGSKLALWQAEYLKSQLDRKGYEIHIHVIKTQGDRIQDLSLSKLEGKGFFTKEIEEALLAEHIDVAVHSMKDLPTEMPNGLVLAGLSERADPADCLIIRPDATDDARALLLKNGICIGTSSARRKAQLQDVRSDVQTDDIRGNVPTRIEKLRRGDVDAIILARAGLDRLQLDLSAFRVVALNPKEFVPAPAQGVLAYQCRQADSEIRHLLAGVHHPVVAERTNVERRVLQLMEAGCHAPLGVYCEKDAVGNFHAWATYAPHIQGPLTRTFLSQSTHYHLAERLFEQLKAT